MSKRGSNSEPFAHENDAITARPQNKFYCILFRRWFQFDILKTKWKAKTLWRRALQELETDGRTDGHSRQDWKWMLSEPLAGNQLFFDVSHEKCLYEQISWTSSMGKENAITVWWKRRKIKIFLLNITY